MEQRRFERTYLEVLTNLAPKVYFPGEPIPYPVLDLSFKGLFIKDQIKYKRGDILDVELEIPAIGKIPMSVMVVWIDTSEKKGIGVEILEIPEEFRKVWAYFIRACVNLLRAKREYREIQTKTE